MTVKGSSFQQRPTPDPMKISSLLNGQNVLSSSHELPQGIKCAPFLAVNAAASSVIETGKSKSTIEAGEPSSRRVASQGEPAGTSKDTWRASSRRSATVIADGEPPKGRPKRMRDAVKPAIRPRCIQYTQEELHFIWYYRVVLLKKWRDIHKSFSHHFTPPEKATSLEDKLIRLIRNGELPGRPKKNQERSHNGKVRRAICHATIEEVVKKCESLEYPWMEEASRTAIADDETPEARSRAVTPAVRRRWTKYTQ